MLQIFPPILLSLLCVCIAPLECCAEDGAAATRTTYYLGESKMTTPNGRVIRTSLSLVKRVVNPAESRIEEHVTSIDEKGAKPFVVVQQVTGSKFKMTERSDSFTGEGELIGEPWKWTAWKSVSTLPGGVGTVVSDDKITDQGMTAKKTFAGPDGKVTVMFDESLKSITAKTYELLYLRLTAGEKK